MFYPFGQDINFTLYTGVDGNTFPTLPTQTGSGTLYVFTTRPSREDALSGTGALSGAFTLTPTANPLSSAVNTLTTTITAIPDPDPSSETRSVEYYFSANIIKKAAGTQETIIRPLNLIRVDAHSTSIGVAEDSLLAVIPDLNGYVSTAEIKSMILAAQRETKDGLSEKGIKWASVHDPEQLYWVVLWKSLELACDSQILKEGDRWDRGQARYEKRHQTAFANLKLRYESNAGGAAVGAIGNSNIIRAIR